MSIDSFKELMYSRSSNELLKTHLEDVYEIKIMRLVKLDLGVFIVDQLDGPSWIARQYSKSKSIESVKGDATVLRFLEQHCFPAERCAHPSPVSTLEGHGVLVTNYVEGLNPKGSPRAYYFLGLLLGRLHSIPIAPDIILPEGGAWHHLSSSGGPKEEITAAQSLLTDSGQSIPTDQRLHYERLVTELKQCSDFHDMPKALIHPDFVPPNMIKIEPGNWTVVDWSGAGLGPRIWSLGFVLWAAGNRDLQCVDAVITGYRKYINLSTEELEQLSIAIGTRPLIFDCWSFCMDRKSLLEVVQGLSGIHDQANIITERALKLFSG